MRGYVFGTLDRRTAAATARPDELWEIRVPPGAPVLLLSQVVAADNLTPLEVLIQRGERFILDSMASLESPGRLRMEAT